MGPLYRMFTLLMGMPLLGAVSPEPAAAPVPQAPKSLMELRGDLQRARLQYDQAKFRQSAAILRGIGMQQFVAEVTEGAPSAALGPERRDTCLEVLELQALNAVILREPNAREIVQRLLKLKPDFDLQCGSEGASPGLAAAFNRVADEAADGLQMPRGDLKGHVTIDRKSASPGLIIRAQGREASTDDTGTYTLQGLRPGRVSVWVSGIGVSDARVDLVVNQGENAGDLALSRPTLVPLSGSVRSAVDGQGIAKAKVIVDDQQCFTDGKGSFSLKEGVPTGQRKLIVSAVEVEGVPYGEVRQTVEVSRGQRSFELLVAPEGPGIIVQTEPAGASVWVDDQPQGQVRTPGLVLTKPGTHFVEVKIPGSKRWDRAAQLVSVPESGVAVLPLQLPEFPAVAAQRNPLRYVLGGLAAATGAAVGLSGGGDKGDTTGPALSQAVVFDSWHVDITFSEPVTKETAEYKFNYTVKRKQDPLVGPLEVLRAVLQTGDTTVRLTVKEQVSDIQYVVTAQGVADTSPNANVVGSANTAQFTGLGDHPRLETVAPYDHTHVDLVFSGEAPAASASDQPRTDPLKTATVETLSSYSIEGPDGKSLPVREARLLQATDMTVVWSSSPPGAGTELRDVVGGKAGKVVRLTVDEQKGYESYTITLGGLTDEAGNAVTTRTAQFVGRGQRPRIALATADDPTTISILFTEKVSTATVSKGAFSITPPSGLTAPTILSATLDPAQTTATLTTTEQTDGAGYTVSVTGVVDEAGNEINASSNDRSEEGAASPFSGSFRNLRGTGGLPEVVSTATSVLEGSLTATGGQKGKVTVQFNEPVTQVTAGNMANYRITPALEILGREFLNASGAGCTGVALITAEQEIPQPSAGPNYQIAVSSVLDLVGNQIAGTRSTTQFEGVGKAPEIASVRSVDGTHVEVAFTEAMDAGSAETIANYTLSGSSAIQVKGAQLLEDRKTVRLLTSAQGRADYSLNVKGVKDEARNPIEVPLADPVFTGTDDTRPQVTAARALDNTHVEITFSEAVTNGVLSAGSFTITPARLVTAVNGIQTPTQVTLTVEEMAQGVGYTVTVNSGVQDLGGNTLDPSYRSAQFTGVGAAPTVVSATAQADTTHVDVVFSEDVDSATANALGNYAISPALTLTDAALQADKRTVRLTTAEQEQNRIYTVTVSVVKDVAGNAVGAPNTATFTGIGQLPTVAPAATVVDSTHVDVTFSEKVQELQAEATGSYAINNGLAVVGAELRTDGATVRLTTSELITGRLYQVTVSTVTDLAGNGLGSAITADFTGQGIAPRVTAAAAVVDSTHVDVTFSESVAAALAADNTNYQINGGALAVTAATMQGANRVRLETPLQTRAAPYTIVVSNVTDVAGNVVDSANDEATFTGVDTIAPVVAITTRVDDTHVDVLFTENDALDGATAGAPGNYVITGGAGLLVTAAVLDADSKTVHLTTAEQKTGQNYSVSVHSVKDVAGNAVATPNAVAFDVPGQGIAPTVTGAAQVDSTHATVTFSEKVQELVAEATGSYAIPGLTVTGAELQTDGVTVRLTTAEQKQAQAYTITVSAVTDLAGNTIGTPDSANFNGIGVAPTVTTASGVDSTHVDVLFSEALQGAGAFGSYTIDNGLVAATAASLLVDGKTVRLTTNAQVGGRSYTITVPVDTVLDVAGNGNTAASPQFTGVSPLLKVLSATRISATQVDVLFDKDVQAAGVTGANDPANYTLTPARTANGVTAASRDGTNNSLIHLTTEEQTSGAGYTVTVANILDLAGNGVDPGANRGSFTGQGVPPRVQSASSPLAAGTQVDVLFDETVDPTSAITVGNYSFTPALTFTAATLDADGKTVHLATAEQQIGTGNYQVKVTSVKDVAGNAIATTNNTATFDGKGVQPAYDTLTRIDEKTVEVAFGEPVRGAVAENLANYVLDNGLQKVSARLKADGRTVVLVTSEQVTGTTYTVTVGAVTDLAGNAMAAPTGRSFGGAGVAPTVVSATPVDATTVDVVFSEALGAAGAAGSYTIAPALGAAATAILQADNKTVRLRIAEQTAGTIYTVTVAALTATDVAGNANAVATAVFTGVAAGPQLLSAAPIDPTHIQLVFSRALNAAGANTAANYGIAPSLGAITPALQSDNKTVVLTTAAAQTINTAYTVTVTGVQDVALNPIGGVNNTASFLGTGAALRVVSATAVSQTQVDVVFGKTLKAATVAGATYSIAPARTVSAPTLQPDNKTIRLTVQTLAAGVTYTVTVAGIQDEAGNTIAAPDDKATFSGTDVVAPSAVSAARVDPTTVDVTFSEEVDQTAAQNTANYTITGGTGLSVGSAVLQANRRTVRLTTPEQRTGQAYTVTAVVGGVKDLAGNVVDPLNNTAAFNGQGVAPKVAPAATAPDVRTINVVLDENMDGATIAPGDFSINGGALAVTAAVLQGDQRTVKLTTAVMTETTLYTIVVSTVNDAAGNVVDGAANTATVTPTNLPPQIASGDSVDNTHVDVAFTEDVDAVSAETAANYNISGLPAVTVTTAVLQPDNKTVRLTTTGQTLGQPYTLTVINVVDVDDGLAITAGNTLDFNGRSLSGALAQLHAVSAGGEGWAKITTLGVEPAANAGRAAGPRFVPVAGATAPARATGRSWTFGVEGGEGDPEVTLSWPNLAGMSAKDRLTLEDLDAGVRRSMRSTAAYTFRTAAGLQRRFRITAEPRSGQSPVISGLSVVAANNGRVQGRVVRFVLSGEASVDVEVLSPSGKGIAQVTRSRASVAGQNQVVWSGQAAAGIYLLRVTATDEGGATVQAVRPVVITR